MLFHCLFCHMYTRKDRDKGYWDLSCDIAMEYVIDGLYQKCVHVPRSALRREIYLRLEKALSEKGPVLTAERVYRALLEMELPERRLDMLKAEFFVDSHDLWEQEDSPKIARSRQNKWNDNREKMQTELETGSKDASEDNRSLLEEVQVENRERYDYSRFLQKFAVLKEEMQVDPDSFDYAFYTYGLSLYGNMPLIEPLESREVYRVEDFAIVIDTSMSCSGELVRRFLEETYDVLSETESYFKKVHLHIIQCDDAVQSDVLVTSQEELKAYMDDFQIRGSGGTDFRPAFEYVNGLKKSRQAASLKGLIYFTDGKGIYPVQAPSYDTAFVFIENMFSDESRASLGYESGAGGGTAHGVQAGQQEQRYGGGPEPQERGNAGRPGQQEQTWTIETGMDCLSHRAGEQDMNIKRAKEEIKDTIEAYLLKDENGEYVIPSIRQRPVLLIGPPGVGKTQIMEQISRECRIGLISYTITHHTRQSAVGLPSSRKRCMGTGSMR